MFKGRECLARLLAIGSSLYELTLPALIGLLIIAIGVRFMPEGSGEEYSSEFWKLMYTAIGLSIFSSFCEWARVTTVQNNAYKLS